MTLDEYIAELAAIRSWHGGGMQVCHVSMQPDIDGESRCTPVGAPAMVETQAERDDGAIERGVVVALAATEADAWEARWAALRANVAAASDKASDRAEATGCREAGSKADAFEAVLEWMDAGFGGGE